MLISETQPLLSVIVAVYNVEDYLPRCLQSICDQTYTHLEILVTDDGSTDSSGQICEDFARRDPRIRVFHTKNSGLFAARNVGLKHVTGDFVGFVDGDDYIAEDMYAALLKGLVGTDADISICGSVAVHNGKERPPCLKESVYALSPESALRAVMEAKITSVTVTNKLFRRASLDGLLFQSLESAEDAPFTVDAIDRSRGVVLNTAGKYFYVHRQGSITREGFRPRCLAVLDAYRYIQGLIERKYPQLRELAQMRLCWAYFYVLDRLTLDRSGDYEQIRKETIRYLNSQLGFVLRDPHFRFARKVSACCLRVSEGLYRLCVKAQNAK